MPYFYPVFTLHSFFLHTHKHFLLFTHTATVLFKRVITRAKPTPPPLRLRKCCVYRTASHHSLKSHIVWFWCKQYHVQSKRYCKLTNSPFKIASGGLHDATNVIQVTNQIITALYQCWAIYEIIIIYIQNSLAVKSSYSALWGPQWFVSVNHFKLSDSETLTQWFIKISYKNM